MNTDCERSTKMFELRNSENVEKSKQNAASAELRSNRSFDSQSEGFKRSTLNIQQSMNNSTVDSSVKISRTDADHSFCSRTSTDAWEYWYLKKELALRLHMQKQNLQKKLECEGVKDKLATDQKRKQLAETVHNGWVEQKNEVYRRKKVKAKQIERYQKAIKEAENKRKHERAEQEYNRWLEFKRHHDAEFKKKQELGMEEQAKLEKERKQKAAAAFNAWLKRNRKEAGPTHNNHELDMDKLIGRLLF